MFHYVEPQPSDGDTGPDYGPVPCRMRDVAPAVPDAWRTCAYRQPREVALRRQALNAAGLLIGAFQNGRRHDRAVGHGADRGRSTDGADADFHWSREFSRSKTISRCATRSPSRSIRFYDRRPARPYPAFVRLQRRAEQYLEFAKSSGAGSARFASPSIACSRATPKSEGYTRNWPSDFRSQSSAGSRPTPTSVICCCSG